jgi:hypothetical protein
MKRNQKTTKSSVRVPPRPLNRDRCATLRAFGVMALRLIDQYDFSKSK